MTSLKKSLLLAGLALLCHNAYCWGFFGHRKINYYAVFLLPPEMMKLYKPSIGFLEEHAVDPDKRRYAVKMEAPRHYLDIDRYGVYPFDSLPRKWTDAVARYGIDTLQAHGIVPWWIQVMLGRLTRAFREKDRSAILKYSAELGHYIADSHVPLHTTRNHNGQYTDQKGIHGFWESRIPELLAERNWDFYLGHAAYIKDPLTYTWARVMESAAAVDSVLRFEKELSRRFPGDQQFAFEERNGKIIRQYAEKYTAAYDQLMNGMVERRMRQSILSVASFWYTAWVNAGQPDLDDLHGEGTDDGTSKADQAGFEWLNAAWKRGEEQGRPHE